MKTALRAIALFLCAVIGLWALLHGIFLAASLRTLPSQEEFFRRIAEIGILIAGGICVLSVAVEQLYVLRTHHKDEEGLL